MAESDRVAADVREVERQIDLQYRLNPLLRRPFSEAAWYFLAHCEEVQFKEHIQHVDFDLQRHACVTDEIVNNTKWPLRWLRRDCSPGRRIPASYRGDAYKDAWQLFDLAAEYSDFENAFTYASLGYIQLSVQGNRLVATSELRSDTRYEAYDRLAKPVHANVDGDALSFLSQIDQAVQVSRDKFKYPLNPRIVGCGMEFVAELFPRSLLLPPEWRFPRYSIADFDRVTLVLQTLALIHFRSRMRAAAIGCVGCGYSNALLLMGAEELQNRVVRYTGVPELEVRNVLADLTYGSSAQVNADPALQPLIPLAAHAIAITPTLILGNDLRRNFCVLLNRMALEKVVYSQLNTERETKRREALIREFGSVGYRTWHGPWPGGSDLPDIDLVVIDDCQKQCLFIELKTFIEPAEAREISQRDEEVAKGVRQAKLLRGAFQEDSGNIRRVLGIDDRYTASFVVASESGIGSCLVRDRSVPVIRTGHLLNRTGTAATLKELCDWLDRGDFLPLKGIHYDEVNVLKRIGPWELEWYGIKPLSAEQFG